MAAVAMLELLQVLHSNQEKITDEEINVLVGFRAKARASAVGALIGGATVWGATRKLSTLLRVNLSAGAAVCIGQWSLIRSINSDVDHILGLDGTRMQRELANIIIRKNHGENWRWKLMSKHFYSEIVYEDSAPDVPRIRWRVKNFFSDKTVHDQRTQDSGSPSNSSSNFHSASNYSQNVSDGTKNDLESKQAPVNSGAGMIMDPFDCVFGYTPMVEEMHLPGASSTTGRVLTRNHKRSHRRRRMRHQEVSLETQGA